MSESDSATLSGCTVVFTSIDLEGLASVPKEEVCKHGMANGSPEGMADRATFSLMLPSSVSV